MEEVFDLREFVIKILRGFRLIFVLSLLCAAILIGYKLYQVWPELTGVKPVILDLDTESNELVEEQKAYINDQIFYYEQCAQHFQNSLDIIKNADSEQRYALLEEKLEVMWRIKDSNSELIKLKNQLKLFDENPVVITKSSITKSIIKYAALGLLIGFGIGLAWIFFADVMNLRIRSSEEMAKKFELESLAEFYHEEKRKPFAKIDKWIDRLDGISLEKPTEKQSTDILAASLEGLTGGDIQKVLITGDVPLERLERLTFRLTEKMQDADVSCAGDITLSPEALKLAKDCKEIVLVIRKNEVTYPNVEKQLKCYANIGKKVLGFVMV